MADKTAGRILGVVAVILIVALSVAAGAFYLKAGREAKRVALTNAVFVTWMQDWSERKKDLPRFMPAVKAALAEERAASPADAGAMASRLFEYALMSSVTHLSFGTGGNDHPAVKAFEAELGKELGEQLVRLSTQKDERLLNFLALMGDSDSEELLSTDVLQRLYLDGLAMAQAKPAGSVPEPFYETAGSRFNHWSWEVAKESNKSAAEYARALTMAEASVAARKDQATYVNTLAMAQYRMGKYQDAATTIARAVTLRKEPRSLDGVIVAMSAARLGKTDEARQALAVIDERLAAQAKDAIAKKRKPYVDSELQRLLAEARALLPVAAPAK